MKMERKNRYRSDCFRRLSIFEKQDNYVPQDEFKYIKFVY